MHELGLDLVAVEIEDPHRPRLAPRRSAVSSGMMSRVYASSAGMSEATRPTPSAAPTMIGGSCRATTITSGSSTWMHTRANAPFEDRDGLEDRVEQRASARCR